MYQQQGEQWDDDFDHAEAGEASDTPPSSSAVLFARLTQPRAVDRDESSVASTNTLRGKLLQCGNAEFERGESSNLSFDAVRFGELRPPSETVDKEVSVPIEDDGDIEDNNPNADLSFEDLPEDDVSLNSGIASAATSKKCRKQQRGVGGCIPRLQETAFRLVDAGWAVGLTFVVVLVDAAFFFIELAFLHLPLIPHSFATCYVVMDCLTALLYFIEVNLRLFSYSPSYFFHSRFRCMDYFICTANFSAVLASVAIRKQPFWLDLVRFIRIFRIVNIIVLSRERRLKAQALTELQEVAVLLDQERSDKSRLVKWRIDSKSIAIGKEAGQGGFGSVFVGLFRGTLVAVKQLYGHNCRETMLPSIEAEAITLVNLRHPNVVLFMGFVQEPYKLWIVTEYCSRGSVRDLLDSDNYVLTPNKILKFALGAARGLAYLHGQDPPVLHLDLKSSNILVTSGWEVKLADFGLSRNMHNIQNNTFAGTVQYSAPEILESNNFTVAADIYSFGVCMWEMAARKIPFEGTQPIHLLWGVVKEDKRPPLNCIRSPTSSGLTSQQVEDTLGHGGAIADGGKIDIRSASSRSPETSPDAGSRPKCADLRGNIADTYVNAHKSIEHAKGDELEHTYLRQQSSENFVEEEKRHGQSFRSYCSENVHRSCENPRPEDINDASLFSPVTPSPVDGSSLSTSRKSNHEDLQTPRLVADAQGDASAATLKADRSDDSNRICADQASCHETSRSRLSINTLPPSKEASFTTTGKSQTDEASERALNRRRMIESLGLAITLDTKQERGGLVSNISLSGGGWSDSDNGFRMSLSPIPGAQSIGFDPLTSCVTAKMQLFDDLPSVAKRAPLPPVPATLSEVVNSKKVREAFGFRKPSDTASAATVKSPANRNKKPEDDGENEAQNTFQRRLHSFSTMPPTSSKGKNRRSQDLDETSTSHTDENSMGNHFPGHCSQGPVVMPDEFVDLIQQCWAKDPAQRPTADEVVWRLVSIIDGCVREGDDIDDTSLC